jgi:pSer/pThr/pTyr-binding forkhead associated (FHA) protein
MEVRLLVANGRKAGQIVPVSGPKFFVGRAEDCHLRPRSDTVSRHHCALLIEGALVLVRDLGSKNGTFVNDERVRPEAEVKNGDRLRIGQLEFEVQMVTDIGGKKKPAVQSVQEAAVRTATATGPLGEEDIKLDDWLAGGAEPPVSETATIENTWTDTTEAEPEEEAEEKPESPDPAATKADTKPIKEEEKKPAPAPAASWNKKPGGGSIANTRDAAGEALKQFLRGR